MAKQQELMGKEIDIESLNDEESSVERNEDVESLSYEDAYDRLEVVVAKLESGELSLEESVAAYAKGQALSTYCQTLLEHAKLKITQVDGTEFFVSLCPSCS